MDDKFIVFIKVESMKDKRLCYAQIFDEPTDALKFKRTLLEDKYYRGEKIISVNIQEGQL